MNPRGKKLEPKLGVDMPFDEFIQRLIKANPKEVERSIEKSKKKPREGRKPKRKPKGR